MNKLLASFAFFVTSLPTFASLDLGAVTSRTPYDAYIRPVTDVLTQMRGDGPQMDRVMDLMREGRSFRYSHRNPLVAAAPEVTAAEREGDCKDKSLWLCNELQDASVRYVIGKLNRNSRINHAWVMWKHEDRWWILDCTMTTRPIAADTLSDDQYVPFYSYSKSFAYRHTMARNLASNTASNRGASIASRADRR